MSANDSATVAHSACSCSPNPPLPESFSAAAAADSKSASAAAVSAASDASAAASTTKPASATAAAATDSATTAAASAAEAISAKWASLLNPPTAAAAAAPPPALSFEYSRHVSYFSMHLRSIPQGYESLDTSRMTMLYFCLSGLDVLGALQAKVGEKEAKEIIEWIYAQQVLPPPVSGGSGAVGSEQPDYSRCGFRGGSSLGVPHDPHRSQGLDPSMWGHDQAHIAMTYTALCCLRILGDTSFSRVDRRACIGALRFLQQDDGSFSSTSQRSESDMRFLYCACAISAMLDDWTGFDLERSLNFIKASQSYDGGIGLWPGCEGHGGSTYTAIAALTLMRQATSIPTHGQASSLPSQQASSVPPAGQASSPSRPISLSSLPSLPALLKWCIANQGSGFRGRPNKPEDSCYSFWIGASLRMIGEEIGEDVYSWTAPAANRQFNLRCQSAKYGGFSKEPGPFHPDLLHSYFGVCGLSLAGMDKEKLGELDVVLGLTKRAAAEELNTKVNGSN